MPSPSLFLAIAMLAATASHAIAEMPRVAVTQIVEHPALDACREGIKDALAEQGYVAGETLGWSFESAQANPVTATQIARLFVGDGADVIVAISTPSAQATAAATRTIPIVFSGVTDPKAAKLVADLEHPGGNVTGVSDKLPVKAHLALVRRLVPEARHLGVLYNPGEVNAVSIVEEIKAAAPEAGFTVVEATAPRTADVLTAARSLVGRADAVYVPTDNTIVAALEAVIKVGREAKLPVFAGDTDSVARGAIAAVGFDYYQVGRETGAIVARILAGEKPGDIPVGFVDATALHVNLPAAAAMGVTIPEAVIAEAEVVHR